MIHGRARREHVNEARKLRQGPPWPRRMSDVVARKTDRKHAAPLDAVDIARLQSPAEYAVGNAIRVDVQQLGETALRESFRLLVEKGARHEPRSQVRARDEFERGRTADRIHRHPHAEVASAFDVVIRLILMPRCSLARCRLLGQHVIVI